MSTTGTVAFPDRSADDGIVVAAVGFPRRLEKASWYFSAFLLCFPAIVLVGTFFTDKTILLSLPLLLMAVCGAFGMRLSNYLEKTT